MPSEYEEVSEETSKVHETARASEYEEACEDTSKVHETAISSADAHVYEGLRVMNEKICYQNIAS